MRSFAEQTSLASRANTGRETLAIFPANEANSSRRTVTTRERTLVSANDVTTHWSNVLIVDRRDNDIPDGRRFHCRAVQSQTETRRLLSMEFEFTSENKKKKKKERVTTEDSKIRNYFRRAV